MPKHVRVRFNGDILAWALHEGNLLRATIVQNGLPRGSKYVCCFDEDDGDGKSISLVFEHESFPEAKDGEIPILCPIFTDSEPGWSGQERRRKKNG